MELSRNRNYAIDNLRAFLMICVVAGHLLEILSFSFSRHLYVMIYSFHMPAFAFISGMCCKLDGNTPKRLIKTYMYTYLVFQTLYLLFSNYILDISISVQYTTPYWLLWYLMAMLWWHGMLSMYLTLRSKSLALIISMLVALASGFDATIGYYASLSRALVLFPFFLGGYYSKNIPFFSDPKLYTKQKRIRVGTLRAIAIAAGILLASLIFSLAPQINNKMLYHSYAYDAESFFLIHRLVIMIVAWLWIVILFGIVPRYKIPWFTYCGQNTMPIFLLHGFVVKYLAQHIGQWQLPSHFIPFIIWTILIPAFLSSKPIVAVFKSLFAFSKSN